MSTLLDKRGLIGPIAYLIKNYKTMVNSDIDIDIDIDQIVTMIINNYETLSSKKLMLDKSTMIISENDDIYDNEIFKYFLTLNTNQETLSLIKTYLIPTTLQVYAIENSDRALELFGKIMQSYISNEQLLKLCDNVRNASCDETVKNLRMSIGKKIYAECSEGTFSEDDLNIMLLILNNIIDKANNNYIVWKYCVKYAILFYKAENSVIEGNKMCETLYSKIKNNIFDNDEIEHDYLSGQFKIIDLDNILNILKFMITTAQNNKKVWQYATLYADLFQQAKNPVILGSEVCDLLNTIFRKKMFNN